MLLKENTRNHQLPWRRLEGGRHFLPVLFALSYHVHVLLLTFIFKVDRVVVLFIIFVLQNVILKLNFKPPKLKKNYSLPYSPPEIIRGNVSNSFFREESNCSKRWGKAQPCLHLPGLTRTPLRHRPGQWNRPSDAFPFVCCIKWQQSNLPLAPLPLLFWY